MLSSFYFTFIENMGFVWVCGPDVSSDIKSGALVTWCFEHWLFVIFCDYDITIFPIWDDVGSNM